MADNLGITDEAVAIRAPVDYPIIAPRDQELASGLDGAFDSADPWTLTSASADFTNAGLVSGSVVRLKLNRAGQTGTGSPVDRSYDVSLAVDSWSQHSLTLRRIGMPPNVGSSPGPAGGATGIPFTCVTVQPQVESVVRTILSRYEIGPGGIETPGDFDDLVIRYVLSDLYEAQSRSNSSNQDYFAAKSKSMQADIDRMTANLDARYKKDPDAQPLVLGVMPGPRRRRRWGEV